MGRRRSYEEEEEKEDGEYHRYDIGDVERVCAGVSFLTACTQRVRVVAHAYIEDRIEPRSREAKSGERMKPATANHQPRLERSSRPTVDSLES